MNVFGVRLKHGSAFRYLSTGVSHCLFKHIYTYNCFLAPDPTFQMTALLSPTRSLITITRALVADEKAHVKENIPFDFNESFILHNNIVDLENYYHYLLWL